MTKKKLQADFSTPAESMMALVNKIVLHMRSKGPTYTSRYRSQARLKSMEGILLLAMAGNYGFITPPDKERIAQALDKLGELMKENRREIRRPEPSTQREFHI